MSMLTHGRTEARRHIFNHLLFLVEKMCSFDSVDYARQFGCRFIIPDAASGGESEVADLELDENSRWSIPTTEMDVNTRPCDVLKDDSSNSEYF